MGTGRCGTLTLAKMINHCKDVECTHEKYLIPVSGKGIKTTLKSIEKEGFFGDISLNWTFHWETVKKFHPNIKIIILKRNKKDTVKSFLKWTKKNPIFEQEWEQYIPSKELILPNQEFNEEDYWNKYYDYCFKIYSQIPHAFILWTKDLNSYKKFLELGYFLDIPKKNILFKTKYSHKT